MTSPKTNASLTESWEEALNQIKQKVGETTFESWFKNLRVREKSPHELIIETPDEFFKNWIEEHYTSLLHNILCEITSQEISIDYEVNPAIASTLEEPELVQNEETLTTEKKQQNINPRFNFESFVVGPSNRFAHAACMAVAESPAKAYNPLFIYGGVGLGKTHLMQSIAQKIHHNNPKAKLSYLSSEKFTNELINAIQHRSTAQFRQKYRNIDILLIDDIHFIAGKESTQEEFFHTFNTLHNNRKQIIISSDRPPKEISKLEERLVSRFAWGLITDIQPPDFETRVAILRKKIEKEPIEVPDEVILFIAQEIKTNIRELEGALIRVVAYSMLEESPISLEMAKFILKDMVQETVKIITIEDIQKNVADYYKVKISDLKASRRSRNVVLPRQVAIYLCRKLTNLSLPEIGSAFGGRDHTTALHSFKKIDQDIKKDSELNNTIEKLTTSIQY